MSGIIRPLQTTHSAEFAAPEIVAGLRKIVLTAQLLDWQPNLSFAQKANDLLPSETLPQNINGLIRQYLPKGTDLSVHSQEELDTIASQLNMRPRKRFDFKCPIEVMGEVMQKVMAMRQDTPISIQ